MSNEVISGYAAIIDGARTGLAGCRFMDCLRRSDCLRADPRLIVDEQVKSADCNRFIPIVPLAARAS